MKRNVTDATKMNTLDAYFQRPMKVTR